MSPPTPRRRKFSGRTSGANIPHVHVYICRSCQGWNNGKKPAQCDQCGSLQFIHFPSKAEAKRYGELMLEQRAGLISDLETQPRFPLNAVRFSTNQQEPKHWVIKIGSYVADFKYHRHGEGIIIEDVKGGADTPLSAWKRKHAEAQYGIKIEIVKR